MAHYTIFIGTIGSGLMFSRDGGVSWGAATANEQLPGTVGGLEGNVRALAVYPDNAQRILAGTDLCGLYRSEDNGRILGTAGVADGGAGDRAADGGDLVAGGRPGRVRHAVRRHPAERFPVTGRGADVAEALVRGHRRAVVAATDPGDGGRSPRSRHCLGRCRGGRRAPECRRRRYLGAARRGRAGAVLQRRPLHGIRNGARPAVYVTSPFGFAPASTTGRAGRCTSFRRWTISPTIPTAVA